DTHSTEFRPPLAPEDVRRCAFDLGEREFERFAEQPGGLVVIFLRAAVRLGNDPVDHPQLERVQRIWLERRRRLPGLPGVPPENGCAALGADGRVERGL